MWGLVSVGRPRTRFLLLTRASNAEDGGESSGREESWHPLVWGQGSVRAGDGQDHLVGERVPSGDGGAERGLVPAVGKGRPDRPGPPRRATQVDDAGVPAPTAAPAVHLGHVLRLRPDAEMPQGNAAGLITGVQQADPHRAQPVSKLEHPQVRPHGTYGARGAHLEPTVAVIPDRPDPVVIPAGTSSPPGGIR